MFRKKWRDLVPEPVRVLVEAVAGGLFVGMVVLEPLFEFLNLSFAGESGWLHYAFYGACGWVGWYLVNKSRKKNST